MKATITLFLSSFNLPNHTTEGKKFTLYGIELVSTYGYVTGHFKGRNASKMLYIGQASSWSAW